MHDKAFAAFILRALGLRKGAAFVLIAAIVFVPFANVSFAASGVPKILNYQGRLLDASGVLLGGSGTEYCFKFSFYDVATVGSGTKLWPTSAPSSMTAIVKNGVFTVGIGDTNVGGDVLDYDFQSTDATYINVEVATKVGATCAPGDGAESFENLSPRQRIYSSGYAINSGSVGGYSAAQLLAQSFATTSADYWKSQNNFFSTTSVDYWMSGINFFSTSSADYLATQRNFFSTSSAEFFVSQFNFFSTSSVDYWKSITSFFSTTSADYLATQRNYFSTTSAQYFLQLNQPLAFSTSSATFFLSLNSTLAFSTTSADYWKSQNNFFSTTSTDFFVTQRNFFSTTSAEYWKSITDFFATTSAEYLLTTYDKGFFFSTTSTDYYISQANLTSFSTTSADYWKTARDFFSTTSASYFASLGLAFSTTSNDYWKSQNNFFSTSSTDYYANASTTIVKTYATNVFSALQTFGNASTTNLTASYASSTQGFFGSLSIGTLSGVLKAATGAVTAGFVNLGTEVAGVLGVTNGGTGTSTMPALGQLLVGNALGGYDLISTSSLGITASGDGTFSTTSADYLATQRNFFSTSSADYFLAQNQSAAFSTSSATFFLSQNTSLAFSTTSTDFWKTQNNFFSTSSSDFFVTQRNFFSTTSTDYWKSVTDLFSTSSSEYLLTTYDKGFFFSTTSTDYYISQANIQSFSTTSADYWKTARDFFSTTSTSYFASLGLAFSTTSNDYWKSQNNFFSTSSADYYANSSTTIPKTYTANTFTGLQTFNSASTTAISATNASTTNLTVSSVSAVLLKTDAAGKLVAAVAGTDYLSGDTVLFATTSADYWSTQRNFFSTSSAQHLFAQTNFFSTSSADWWKAQNNFFSTTSADYYIAQQDRGVFFSTTSASYFLAQNQAAAFATTSADFWKLQNNFFSTTSADFLASQRSYFSTSSTDFFVTQRNFFSTSSANYWKSITDFFSTTSADYFASQRNFFSTSSADYLATQRNFFSTTSAIFFADASTTIAKTYTDNTFLGTQMFNNIVITNATTTSLFASIFSAVDGTFGDLFATSSATLASTTAYGQFLTGNIVATSSATSSINGAFLVGLATSSFKASILGTASGSNGSLGTGVLTVTNNNSALSSANNVLRLNLRTPGASCNANNTCPRFIEFFAGTIPNSDFGGTGLGRISMSTAGTGITQTSGAADFAEYMTLNSAASVGDLVSLNSAGEYQKAVAGQSLIGVVSDNPAFVGNGNLEGTTNAYVVGFAGVIQTTVSAANGPIAAGDFIAASTTAGVGVKLLHSGYALGQALQSYSGVGNGTITVLVMPKYIDAAVGLDSYGGTGGGITGYWNLSTSTGQVSLASSTYSLVVPNVSLTNASSTAFSSIYASSTQAFFGSLSVGSLTGVLRAASGVVTTGLVNLTSEISGVLGIGNGGTGTSTAPSYGQLLVGNALGGYDLISTSSLGIIGDGTFSTTSADYLATQRNFFSTSSADYFLAQNQSAAFSTTSATFFLSQNTALAFSTSSTDYWKTQNNFFATSSADFFVTRRNFFSTSSTDYWKSVTDLFSTTSADYLLTTYDKGFFFSTTSTDYYISQANIQSFSTTSADYWKTARDFFSTTSASYFSSLGLAFSTTSNDYWKSQNNFFSTSSADYLATQRNYFSTTSADYYTNASSTVAKTYTANVFTALQSFNSASTTAISATNASTTELVISSAPAVLLKTDAAGKVVAAVSGTDYLTGATTLFSTSSADFFTSQRNFFSTSSADWWKSENNFFSTTSATYYLSQNAPLAFSTSSTNYWKSVTDLFSTTSTQYLVSTYDKGYFFSTTSADAFAVQRNFFSTSSADYLASQRNFFSTSSASYFLSFNQSAAFATTSADFWKLQNNFFSTTSADYWSSGLTFFSTTSAQYWKATENFFATSSVDFFVSQRNFFSTSSANYWKSITDLFSTTSANYFVDASSTIPKTYANNTFVGTQTFNSASTTAISAENASTTNLVVSAISSALLKTDAVGNVAAAIAGTDYLTAADTLFSTSSADYWTSQRNFFSTSSADFLFSQRNFFATSSADWWKSENNFFSTTSSVYFADASSTIVKTYTANTFTAEQTFNWGLLSLASTTIGDGTQAGGLTILGGATTTGNAYFGGLVGIGTTSPGSELSINNVANFTTGTSSIYSAGGIDLANGCFSVNGTCVGGVTGSPGAGVIIGIQVYSTPGTYTYTPSTGAVSAEVVVVGAGGGGGGATGANADATEESMGGAGGAGGTAIILFDTTASTSVQIGVGTGGSAGSSSGGDGTAGEASYFSTYASSTGGGLGTGATNTAGTVGCGADNASGSKGAAGVGQGGSLNMAGGPGIPGSCAAESVGGGDGGSSYFGGGGRGAPDPNSNISVAGSDGTYGGGGGAAVCEDCGNVGAAGGSGGNGIVVVYEYGPFQGVVTTAHGGTGTSTSPIYGQLFVGNALGQYDLVSTSSLAVEGILSTSSVGYWASQNNFFSTSSTDYYVSQNNFFSTSSATFFLSLQSLFSTTSADFWSTQRNFFSTSSANFFLLSTSTFSTTTADFYVNASTTIPKTYVNNFFLGTQSFDNISAASATTSALFTQLFVSSNAILGTLVSTSSTILASTTAYGKFIAGNVIATSTATSSFSGPLTVGVTKASSLVSILGGITGPTSASGTAILTVSNDDNTLSSGNNVLRLNLRTPYATTCVTGTTCPRFMEFFTGVGAGQDTGGRGVGSLRLSTAGTGITQTSGSADFAEYMQLNSSANVGDLVSLNASGEYQKAVAGQSLIGVISDNPAFVGNGNLEGTPNAYIVGFAGVIQTTVSASSGPIVAGDFIAASTTAGVGVKLQNSGFALGQALESYSGVGLGTIKVLVLPKYIDAAVALTSYGGTGGGTTGYWSLSTSTGLVTLASSTYSLMVNNATINYASTTMITAGLASTTNLIVSSAGGATGCAQFDAIGRITNTGTACGTGTGGSSGFSIAATFGTTTAATSSSIWTQGVFFASSTKFASQFPYASSTAFTTGNLFVNNFLGIGTSSPGSALSIGGIANFTAATSTIYSAGGIELSNGCFKYQGQCLTNQLGTNVVLTAVRSGNATTTWTVPSNLVYVVVEIWGGGGGGGGGGTTGVIGGTGATSTFGGIATSSGGLGGNGGGAVRSGGGGGIGYGGSFNATGTPGGASGSLASGNGGDAVRGGSGAVGVNGALITGFTGNVFGGGGSGAGNTTAARTGAGGGGGGYTQITLTATQLIGTTSIQVGVGVGGQGGAGGGTGPTTGGVGGVGGYTIYEYTASNVSIGNGTVNSGTTGQFAFYNATGQTLSATSNIFTDTSTNYIGVGSTTPWGLLSINPDGLLNGAPEFVIGSSSATHFLVDTAGRVGVSSTTPFARFGIEMGSTFPYTFQVSNQGSTTPAFSVLGTSGNGRIGIGTSTPWAQLSLDGSGGVANSPLLSVGSSSGTYFLINNGGRVGIGTSTPSEKFAVEGNGMFTGNFISFGTVTASKFVATSTIASQFLYASTTAFSATHASTTNLTVSSVLSSLLKTDTAGKLVAAVGGVDYANFGYLFDGNSTSTTLTFTNGLLSFSSSTLTNVSIQNSTTTNATTTALAVLNLNSVSCDVKATTGGVLFCGGDAVGGGGSFPFTPTTNYGVLTNATSTPLSLFGGFFASSSIRFGNAGIGGFVFDSFLGRLGIGTTSPAATLGVVGSAAAANAAATGLDASSTLAVIGGSGGNTSIATIGTGGSGSSISVAGGVGGSATAAAVASTGGVGGSVTIAAGAGGDSTVTGLTNVGGNGGNVVINPGAGGAASGGATSNIAGNYGNLLLATAGGNVGIGTSTPGSKLSVQGNIFLAGNITSTSTLASTFLYASSTAISTNSVTATNATTTSLAITNISNGLVSVNANGSVGTTSLSNGLTFTNNTLSLNLANQNVWTGLQLFGGGASSTQISAQKAYFGGTATTTFDESGNVTFGNASADILVQNGVDQALNFGTSTAGTPTLSISTRASRSGLVGIGTTTPWAKFAVDTTGLGNVAAFAVGSSNATTFIIDSAGRVGVSSSTPFARFGIEMGSTFPDTFQVSNEGSTTPALIVLGTSGNGRIGVGTSTPWAQFSIDGSAGVANSPLLSVGSSSGTYFMINNGGRVGIGSTSPNYTLDVNGDVNVASGKCFRVNGVCIGYTTRLHAIYSTSTPGLNATVVFTGAVGSAPSFAAGAPGSLTLPVNTTHIVVETRGGGGAGGGVNNTNAVKAAGGGGQGGYSRDLVNTPTGTYRYSVGAGGVGATGVAGTWGRPTCFGTGATACTSPLIAADGGAGAALASGAVSSPGGAGATSTSPFAAGNFKEGGAAGANSTAIITTALQSGAGGGAGGGAGRTTSGTGNAGSNGGGGGGGAQSTAATTQQAGGNGGAGVVIITVYATTSPTVTGNDYAEMFPVSDPAVTAGDIVAVDSGLPVSMKLAERGDRALAGVISSAPGQVLGDQSAQGMRPVAFSGRVPVKFSNENGDVQIGDRIALSSVAGVGRKANVFDDTVGIVIGPVEHLESGIDSVMIFMDLQRGIDVDAIAMQLLGTNNPIFANLASSTSETKHAGPMDFVGGMMSAIGDRISVFGSTSQESASTTDATSTPELVDNFAQSLIKSISGAVMKMLADAGNGIGSIFAKALHAKEEICIDDQCLSRDDIKTVLEMAHNPTASSGSHSATTNAGGTTETTSDTAPDAAATSTSEVPVIAIQGNNPATIDQGSAYTDLGAVITGPSSAMNLGIKATIDGGAEMDMSAVAIDTSAPGDHTIVYRVTDANGNVGEATRTVHVVAPPQITTLDDTNSTSTVASTNASSTTP